LNAAVENGWLDVRSASLDPRFDRCASDPRFKSTLARVKDKVTQLRQQISTAETTNYENSQNN
jgi:hypothetical protein